MDKDIKPAPAQNDKTASMRFFATSFTFGGTIYKAEAIMAVIGLIADTIRRNAELIAQLAGSIEHDMDKKKTLIDYAKRLAFFAATLVKIGTPAGKVYFVLMNLPEILKAIRAISEFIADEDKISPQMKEAASALFTEIRTLTGLSEKIKDAAEPHRFEEANDQTAPDAQTVSDKQSETASYNQQAYDAYLTLTSYFTSAKPKDETDKT